VDGASLTNAASRRLRFTSPQVLPTSSTSSLSRLSTGKGQRTLVVTRLHCSIRVRGGIVFAVALARILPYVI
jgi:hypothetical protein